MLISSRVIASAAASVLGLALTSTVSYAEPVKFDFWYGLSGDLSNVVQQMCSDFNKSQADYQIVCTSQTNYDTNLQNTIAAGVGNLVDADLAKESANLQALQTKQQLGIQALSIANQSSSTLLSLFR